MNHPRPRHTTLLARAQRFISHPAPDSQEFLLQDCVAAQTLDGLSAVQLVAEDMYGGITYNFELKCPAAWCLIAWREQGLKALLELARRTPTLKNYSLAFQILGTLAARQRFSGSWPTAKLRTSIEHHVPDWDTVFAAARTQLNALALSIPSDDDAAFYTALPMQYLSLTEPLAVRPLFMAMCARWLSVGPGTLSQYQELLNSNPKDEPAFHDFFEKHSQMLDPMVLDVWSKPDLHGAPEPDFLIRRIDGTYLVVEIETPAKILITKNAQLSANATQAVTQALNYREFLTRHSTEAASTFPQFQSPDSLVVIGLQQPLNPRQRHALRLQNASHAGLKIVGFDWLAERARTLARNVVEGRIDARRVRMA